MASSALGNFATAEQNEFVCTTRVRLVVGFDAFADRLVLWRYT